MLKFAPSWPAMHACPHEEWHYLPLVPCPTLLFLICCEVCTQYHCSCLLGQQPGAAVENPNSPFGTWEPHTSFFWWFLSCFVLFKIIPAPRAPGKNGIKHCLCRPMLIGFHLYSRGRVSQGYNLVVMVGTINTRKYEFIATEKRTFR